ncbi:MAG: glycosyltransferase [Candidatus Zipacnadales bacterium]
MPYYMPAAEYGGPAIWVHESCQALAHSGVLVTVLTTNAGGMEDLDVPVGQPTFLDGVQVYYYPRQWPRRYFYSPQLKRSLQARVRDFDIVHIHGLFTHTAAVGARLSHAAGVPYVLTVHGSLDPVALTHGRLHKRPYLRWVERWSFDHAARLIALSDTETVQIQAYAPQTPVVTLPIGLPELAFAPPPPRNSLGPLAPALVDEPYFLFMSRLHPKKGAELLIQAFRECLRSRPELRLVIAGTGDPKYAARLRATVSSHERDRVLFVGHVAGDTKRALLAHALAFCLPSESEGLPMAVVEALATATPVVITPQCQMPWVGEYGAGWIVPRQPEAWAHALRRLAQDLTGRSRMAERAKKLARERFDGQELAVHLCSLYEEVVAEKGTRGGVPHMGEF